MFTDTRTTTYCSGTHTAAHAAKSPSNHKGCLSPGEPDLSRGRLALTSETSGIQTNASHSDLNTTDGGSGQSRRRRRRLRSAPLLPLCAWVPPFLSNPTHSRTELLPFPATTHRHACFLNVCQCATVFAFVCVCMCACVRALARLRAAARLRLFSGRCVCVLHTLVKITAPLSVM